MIKERYCSYEVARLLKEKGFSEPVRSFYLIDDAHSNAVNVTYTITYRSVNSAKAILRPTHQMACDWLREVHKIFIEISVSIDLNGDYHYSYFVLNKDCKYIRKGYTSFNWNYTDAVEEALKYSLENLI